MRAGSREDAQRVLIHAVFSRPTLSGVFVLKGAQALALMTPTRRATYDVDLTAYSAAIATHPNRKAWLQGEFEFALRTHVDSVEPKWTVYAVSIESKPHKPHRLGWDGYQLKATLIYRGRGQQVVEVDLSFDDLTEGTVKAQFGEGGPSVTCYSREQMIAEKLRAFIQKLPPHRAKLRLDPAAPRVKDLGDIRWLIEASDIDLAAVGTMLRAKCIAKYVDFESANDLLPDSAALVTYARLYGEDPGAYPWPFAEVWERVLLLVEEIRGVTGLPGRTPLPDGTAE